VSTAEAVACCGPLAAPTLSDEQACVCHLIEPLGLSQPTVSHHLKKLTDAGLLEREQRGRWAYFSLRPEAVETLATVADLKGVCC
jgi:ArsR family transcriptional regulator